MQETCDRQDKNTKNISWLPICCIMPRNEHDEQESSVKIRELADSIRRDGLISPITVRENGDGRYTVVSGNKRLAACKMCGMTRMDAVVLPAREQNEATSQLLRAIASGQMHYLDEAEALCHLRDKAYMTEDMLAFQLRREARDVHERMRLMNLDAQTREAVRRAQMPERAALALLELPSDQMRLDMVAQAQRDKLGVRDIGLMAESAARRKNAPVRGQQHAVAVVRDSRLYLNALREIVRQMQESGVPAQISESETMGQVELVVRIPQRKRRMIRCHHAQEAQSV